MDNEENTQSQDGGTGGSDPKGGDAGGAQVPQSFDATAVKQMLDDLQKKFTTDLEVATKKAHDSAFAEARRVFEGKGQKKGEAKQDTRTDKVDTASSAGPDSKKWATFNRKAAALGLSDAAIDRMAKSFETDNPDDPVAWVNDYATDFNLGTKVEEKKAADKADDKSNQVSGSNGNGGGNGNGGFTPAPRSHVTQDRPEDVTKWGEDVVNRFIRENGAVPGNPYHPRNLPAFTKLRHMLEKELATTRVYTGPKR